jgi:hypothetical protein
LPALELTFINLGNDIAERTDMIARTAIISIRVKPAVLDLIERI